MPLVSFSEEPFRETRRESNRTTAPLSERDGELADKLERVQKNEHVISSEERAKMTVVIPSITALVFKSRDDTIHAKVTTG